MRNLNKKNNVITHFFWQNFIFWVIVKKGFYGCRNLEIFVGGLKNSFSNLFIPTSGMVYYIQKNISETKIWWYVGKRCPPLYELSAMILWTLNWYFWNMQPSDKDMTWFMIYICFLIFKKLYLKTNLAKYKN